MAQIIITVSEVLRPFAQLAVTRLGYLYPKMIFSNQEHTILVSGDIEIEIIQIRRDVLYALYREKIYAESLSMRIALLNVVSSP